MTDDHSHQCAPTLYRPFITVARITCYHKVTLLWKKYLVAKAIVNQCYSKLIFNDTYLISKCTLFACIFLNLMLLSEAVCSM